MKIKLTTLLGGIGIGALLLLPINTGNSAPVTHKTVPAARIQQADPEATAAKNAPRLKEAMTNLNSRIQLVYKGHSNATFWQLHGVLIAPKKTFTTPYNTSGTFTVVLATNTSATPLKYTTTVDGATITGDIKPTGIHQTFNPRGIQPPSIKIENTSNEAIFLVWANILEYKYGNFPELKEDRLQKLGVHLVDRTEGVAKASPDAEFPYNTISIHGGYISKNGGIALQFNDFNMSQDWYITACGDERTDHLALEVIKILGTTRTTIATGENADNHPDAMVPANKNLTTGVISLKNYDPVSLCAFIRFK
jgi:hypothetical protein